LINSYQCLVFYKRISLLNTTCQYILICAHRLRIETGRNERIRNSQGNLVMLDRGERKSLHCTLNEVEDESHMLLVQGAE
jgi:hypothetical protein